MRNIDEKKLRFLTENLPLKSPQDSQHHEYDYESIIDELDSIRLWDKLSSADKLSRHWITFYSIIEEHTYVLTEDRDGYKYVNIETGSGKASGQPR